MTSTVTLIGAADGTSTTINFS